MKYYADTGFLLSLHLQETTSAAAAAIMQTVTEPLPVTPLVALEFRNALRLAPLREMVEIAVNDRHDDRPAKSRSWTKPMSMRKPIMEKIFNVVPVSKRPRNTPINENGSDAMIATAA